MPVLVPVLGAEFTLVESPVLPFTLPVLPMLPVLQTRALEVLCTLPTVVPVLVPVLGADALSWPCVLVVSSPLPPL